MPGSAPATSPSAPIKPLTLRAPCTHNHTLGSDGPYTVRAVQSRRVPRAVLSNGISQGQVIPLQNEHLLRNLQLLLCGIAAGGVCPRVCTVCLTHNLSALTKHVPITPCMVACWIKCCAMDFACA